MRKTRLLFLFALLMTAVTGAWADDWTNIVKNSNMEGTDASCFYVKENALTSEKVFIARITDGIGKDGSRAIKVTTDCKEAQDWDTQFFIRLPYELPAGTKYRISFDYKSNKADNDATSFQCAKEPGQYIIWYMDASQPSFEFTADWKHFDGEFTIPSECNGTQSDDGSYLKIFQTFAVSLAKKNSEVTEYIFDNVKVEIDANVLAGLTECPATAPDFLRVYPDPNHQHNFSYKANGATITATCTAGCTIVDDMELTLSAPQDLLFNYKAKKATLKADYNKTAFPGNYTIEYYQGSTKLSGAPVHTGNYTAKVTAEGQTASVDFTINGQTPIKFVKKTKLGNNYIYQVSTLTEYLPVESTNDYCILLDGRTYVVKGNVVLSKGLIYKGSLNLLVCDKAKLTVKGGIWHVGSQLDIYAEQGAEQTATIDVQGDTSIELEGIANQPALSGNIVLNSGKLTATPAVGGKLAADDLELTIASGVSGGALTGGTLQDDGSTKFTAAQVNSLTSLMLTTPATNGVKLASDTEDADNWTISDGTSEAKGTATLPNVAEGTTVTATYSGSRKVKSVKAVKKNSTPAAIPLTIEAITAGTINVDEPMEGMQYSLNGGAKTTMTAYPTTINVAAGDKVQFYGNGTSITSYYGTNITGSGNGFTCKVYGNIMSLVDETGFATAKKLSANPTFYRLFAQNTMLTDASGLLLPATELAQECYSQMFRDCTALTAAPEELPATELAGNCYRSMFMGCTALTTAPVLPATELVERCYYQMFINCSKLATVTCLAESGINTNSSTTNWLRSAGSQVEGTKTVYTVSTANWPEGDTSGIPTGWTRVNVDN